jgi:hypothetical protein
MQRKFWIFNNSISNSINAIVSVTPVLISKQCNKWKSALVAYEISADPKYYIHEIVFLN